MLTIHAVPPAIPVLVGRLRISRSGRIKGRPALTLEVWCAWCRCVHEIDWVDAPFPMETATPARLPCRSGPFAGAEVMVGLDPNQRLEHQRQAADHRQALRRWTVEDRLRHQLAVDRKLDRVHHREWGGM